MKYRTAKYDGEVVRTEIIDGEFWVVWQDVSKIFGDSDPDKLITDLVEESDRMKRIIIDDLQEAKEIWLINENGLYNLLLNSSLKNTKDFKKWLDFVKYFNFLENAMKYIKTDTKNF